MWTTLGTDPTRCASNIGPGWTLVTAARASGLVNVVRSPQAARGAVLAIACGGRAGPSLNLSRASLIAQEDQRVPIVSKERVAHELGQQQQWWDVYPPSFVVNLGDSNLSSRQGSRFSSFVRHAPSGSGWLVKPFPSSGGRGIKIFNPNGTKLRAEHIRTLWSMAVSKATRNQKSSIVQQKIDFVDRIDGARYDLRVYLAAVRGSRTSSDRHGRQEVLWLATTDPWVPRVASSPSAGTSEYDRIVTNLHAHPQRRGSWTMERLRQNYARRGLLGTFENVTVPRIEQLFKRLLVALPPGLTNREEEGPASFALLGCDIVLLQDLSPAFIECNSQPMSYGRELVREYVDNVEMEATACLRSHESTRKLLHTLLQNATTEARSLAVSQLLAVRALYARLLRPGANCTQPHDMGWWKRIWRAPSHRPLRVI